MTSLLMQIGGGVIAALLLAVGVQTWRLDRAQDTISDMVLAETQEDLAYADAMAKKADQFAKLARAASTEKTTADEEYNALVADFRTERKRLQNRFVCKVPDTQSSSGSDRPTAGGLSREDVEFLISEAKRADDITRERNLAAKVIEAYEQGAEK